MKCKIVYDHPPLGYGYKSGGVKRVLRMENRKEEGNGKDLTL